MKHSASYWIDRLKMAPLPEEGGLYVETFRSSEVYSQKSLPSRYDGPRAAATDIYYLLQGTLFSAFHRLKTDEIWHFVDGHGLLLHGIDPNGTYTRYRLGTDLDSGEVLRLTVPRGSWFAAEVEDKSEFSFGLASCVMAPGFEFSDFELGQRADLISQYPDCRDVIERLTRA